MEPSSELKREILREYNKESSEWYVFTSKDIRGHIDTAFVHGKDVWFLKEQPINPYQSVGFGVRSVTGELRAKLPAHSFGFRPLNRRLITEILSEESSARRMDLMVENMLRQRPVPLSRIRSPVAIEGPVVYSPSNQDVFPQQQDLDTKLRTELDRLIMRKYPHLTTTYG